MKFARKYSKLLAEDWENFLFSDESRKYLVHYPNPENHIVLGSQEFDIPLAYQVKQSAKVMVCGGITGRGLTKFHILSSGQTLTSKYQIKEILESISETVNLKVAGYRRTHEKKAV